jgi:hypothetical protein
MQATTSRLNVSEEQLKEMKHALGLDYKKRPYRNRYYCSIHNTNWNDLVEKNYAKKLQGWDSDSAYYKLTYEATKAVYGKRMSKKLYDEL